MSINQNVEKKFGAKLAYIRKSKKLSQMKLAELVDMNFNYIGQIERGEANVTIKTMKNIADALGIEVSELFNFTFQPQHTFVKANPNINFKPPEIREV